MLVFLHEETKLLAKMPNHTLLHTRKNARVISIVVNLSLCYLGEGQLF